MKKLFTILGLLITVNFCFAQLPKLNVKEARSKLIQQKQKQFELMKKAESEKTANQQQYDIRYYFLDLEPNPATSILTGSVQIVGEVLVSSLSQVQLNFINNMQVDSIYSTDNSEYNLNYDHYGNILYVQLDSTYSQGQLFDFVVEYHGTPIYGFGFSRYRGHPMIWTLSQPYGARAWWPCKDLPSDKADSVDIRVKVPENLIVASNGTLVEKHKEGNQMIYWWQERYPIIPYLVSLAIYPYAVEYDHYIYNNGADSMKIHFYMFPDHVNELADINAMVKDMIAFFSEAYGPYPFVKEKYGHADFLGGGAMEHQTCSSFAFWNEWVFAHELAHQWWGDLVTCETWHHIWMNEGFATYSEALWFEHAYEPLYGPGLASWYQMTQSLYLGPGTVYVEDPLTQPIFDGNLSYNKGSWVLHMLRHVVGDTTFFDILKFYYNAPEHKFGTVTTEEFQAICENLSGMDLDYFFRQWIYESGYPMYEYAWNSTLLNNGQYQVNGYIDQVQTNYPLYKMPLDITIVTVDTNFITYNMIVDKQTQNFVFTCDKEPLDVALDIENWVLKETTQIYEPEIKYSNHTIDDSEGNNNGHWDTGETIQLVLEIENLGVDVENISVEITNSNTDISIQNPTVQFGDIMHRQSVSNEASPFVLALAENAPGEITRFVLKITDDSGYTDADSFYVEMGKPHVLFVDDDNGENYEQFVLPKLRDARIYSQLWENQILGLPSDTLSGFDTIIWITGDDRQTTLTADEQGLLKNFLDRGGKLLLSGQNIGYDLMADGTAEDSVFYRDYLKADFLADTTENIMLVGMPNDPIAGGLFLNFTAGYDGADNQTSPDAIEPLGSAVKMLQYIPGLQCAGLRYTNESNGSQTIYLPFGIEGVQGPYKNSAVDFITNCLNWFATPTEVDYFSQKEHVVQDYQLHQNYPNPFNPSTVIEFDLPTSGQVSLTIYNILGQKIRTLVNSVKSSGKYKVHWDGVDDHRQNVVGGMYFYRLETGDYSAIRKMILLQ